MAMTDKANSQDDADLASPHKLVSASKEESRSRKSLSKSPASAGSKSPRKVGKRHVGKSKSDLGAFSREDIFDSPKKEKRPSKSSKREKDKDKDKDKIKSSSDHDRKSMKSKKSRSKSSEPPLDRRDSNGKRDSTHRRGRRRDSNSTSDSGKSISSHRRSGRKRHKSPSQRSSRSSSTPPVKSNGSLKARSTSTTPTRRRRGSENSSELLSPAVRRRSSKGSSKTPKRHVKRMSSSDFLQLGADRFALSTSLSGKGLPREQEDREGTLNALVYKLRDVSLEEDLVGLFKRIEAADGFPAPERPSFGNNHIAYNISKVIQNDPDLTSLEVDSDERFKKVKKSLVMDLADSLRANLHLTELILVGVGLGDDFLKLLSDSIRDNFTLKTLILSHNNFTNEGLVEFCNCICVNESIREVDVSHQKTPLEKDSERHALEAFMKNQFLHSVKIDVTTDKCHDLITMIQSRNAKANIRINYDMKLIQYFKEEASNAERLFQLNLAEEKVKHLSDKDKTLLYNLAQIAEIYRIDSTSCKHSLEPKATDLVPNIQYTAESMPVDGSFINADFISTFLYDDPTSPGLIFSLNKDFQLFRVFDHKHDERQQIVDRFVSAIVEHKRAIEITKIIIVEAGVGDDFVKALCLRCIGNVRSLPKLFLLDLEKNHISDSSIEALADCLDDKKTWRYLQTLKVKNQKTMDTGKTVYLSRDSEFAIAKALCTNVSLLRLNITVRHPAVKLKVESYLKRNLDLMFQVRETVLELPEGQKEHQRAERNDLEQIIDRLADNDPATWNLQVEVADQRFLSLKRHDVLKLGRAFAVNKFLTEIRLQQVGLDDEFADTLGISLASNSVIRILNLDENRISGRGIQSIFAGLAKNKSVIEVQIMSQTADQLTDEEEEELVKFMDENESITKVGLNLSSKVISDITKILTRNQQLRFKRQRAKNTDVIT